MAGNITAEYTLAEVAAHNKQGDAWIAIDGYVYDISKFAAMHPGGELLLLEQAGKDTTKDFFSLHQAEVLEKYFRLRVGRVVDQKPGKLLGDQLEPGHISQVPFAELPSDTGAMSPYYTKDHARFRVEVRKLMHKHLLPEMRQRSRTGKPPTRKLFTDLGAAGVWVATMGPGVWFDGSLKALGLDSFCGVKAKDFTYFHEKIMHEERYRWGYPGFSDGSAAGFTIGMPPVLYFAKPEVRDTVGREVFSGRKSICLAITEPYAGSDVAGIRCRAELNAAGTHYVVNGVKKWITNGTFCDYFATAVRTGGGGAGGISMLLIERVEGVSTELIKTSYSTSAGTSYITFENVLVPVQNLLGKEGRGFQVIVFNFNHERWMIGVCAIRASRYVVEQCLKWAHQRQVFGKALIAQPVIRQKLAHMIANLESVSSWCDDITYQMTKLSFSDMQQKLAGPIALFKLRCTRVAFMINDEAQQIFGGRAISQKGMGQVIERFGRSIKYAAILGGSEEIMADLGMKQTMKQMPKVAAML